MCKVQIWAMIAFVYSHNLYDDIMRLLDFFLPFFLSLFLSFNVPYFSVNNEFFLETYL